MTESRQRHLFFLLLALPFFGVFPYLDAINNPNENCRVFTTMALVESRSFVVDPMVRRYGNIEDLGLVTNETGARHLYCLKAPANSYLGVPVYFVQRQIATPPPPNATTLEHESWLRTTIWMLRLFTVQLPCFLFLLWFERYLRDFCNDAVLRLTTVFAVGAGTNYLAYALMFASHALVAVAAFLSFALSERAARREPDPTARPTRAALGVGFFAGLTTSVEYHGLPMSVALTVYGLYVFRSWRARAALIAGGLLHVAGVTFYQWAQFGNPLSPGHQFSANTTFAADHHQGLFGIILPSLEGILGLALPIGSGFLGMSPFMWLAGAGVAIAYSNRLGPA